MMEEESRYLVWGLLWYTYFHKQFRFLVWLLDLN